LPADVHDVDVNGSAPARTISSTICGQRAYTVRVKLSDTLTKKTNTTFTLKIAKP
jgi:hypothetical protein